MRVGCKSETGLSSVDFNETLPQRFAAKCAPKDSKGCIHWLGHKTSHGYGIVRIGGGKSLRTTAHRIAWVLAFGDLKPEVLVLHNCDNPSCVNPEHLSIGSQQDNVTDMVSKKRHAWRERTPWQKLNADDAKTIIILRRAGHTQQEVADRFGVSRPLISMIESNKVQYAAHVTVQESRHR